jgi:hypothetical protein
MLADRLDDRIWRVAENLVMISFALNSETSGRSLARISTKPWSCQ